jgi:hypothetical protein
MADVHQTHVLTTIQRMRQTFFILVQMIVRVQIALEIQDLVILETVVEVAMEAVAVGATKEFSIILILASTC